jgi:membrane protein YqaA with SNARE-associated domain
MLRPRRWIYFAALVSLGSALGVYILSAVLRTQGWPFLLHLTPNLPETHTWKWTVELMDHWGDWTVFLIALSPLPQHPAIALAAFAGIALWKISALVLAGRAIKYFLWAWLATHAPGLLRRFIPFEQEVEELREPGTEPDPSR